MRFHAKLFRSMPKLTRLYQELKNIYHLFQAHIWRAWYRFPDQAICLLGVTGTNGKTTTCYILTSILQKMYGEITVGMLTTVGIRVGPHEHINDSKMTTLQSRKLFKCLRDMKSAGVTHAVIEVTSHALDQHRLGGIRFDGAVFLGIEREHLDYHGTMEEYARAKGRMVRYVRQEAPVVYKEDSEWVKKVIEPMFTTSNLRRIPFISEQAGNVLTPLEGEFNKENALAAILLAGALGIPNAAISDGVAVVKQIPGRMDWVNTNADFRILIDYAVTPDSLEHLYRYIKGVANGNIIAVFGACGLRDRGKRPAMTRVVARYANEIILTREDPWTEDERQIFDDLEKGLRGLSIQWERIVSRKEALRQAIKRAKNGDIIVVTGKGAEQGMGVGKKVIPWNDRAVIEEILKAR